MEHPGRTVSLLNLQGAIYGLLTVNDARIEIVDVIYEQLKGTEICLPHTHTWFECNYVYSGSLETANDGETFEVSAGQIFVVPPGVIHSHKYNPVTPHRGLCIRWQLELAENDAAGESKSMYALLNVLHGWGPYAVPDTFSLKRHFDHLLEEVERHVSPATLQLSFLKVLIALADAIQPGPVPLPNSSLLPEHNLARKVDLYLRHHIRKSITVENVAASLHMSYANLARTYKRVTSSTVIERLNELRLRDAVHYLKHTTLSILEITDAIGFKDQSYFARMFKRAYGLSPKDYRCQHRRT